MELSVIVPFVNEYPQVLFTLQSIAQDLVGRGIEFEVLAVDNWCKEVGEQVTDKGKRGRDQGSEAVKACSRMNKWLTYIEYGDRLSHWQSKNYAVQKSSGKVLWFCDSHCIVGRGAVWGMYKYYVENYQRLHGSIHLPLTYKILEARRLIYKLVYKPDAGEVGYSFTPFREAEEAYEVPCMSCCGVMMSREIYDEMGGWPKKLGIYGGGEQFFNFTMSVLGYSKWIYPQGTLFHHGEKRGYNWNYDDYLKNKYVATYCWGGEGWLRKFQQASKGRPEVKQKFADEVIRECKTHREYIKERQKFTIEQWTEKWK